MLSRARIPVDKIVRRSLQMVIGDRLIDLMGAGLVDTKRVLINNTKIKINRILSDHSYPLAVFRSVRFKAGPNRDTDRGLLN